MDLVYTNTNLSPAEVFASAIGRPYSDLVRLSSLLRSIDLRGLPPYDTIKEVFLHCVDVHKRWDTKLLLAHISPEDVHIIKPYCNVIESYVGDTDLEYVIEQINHFCVSTMMKEFSHKVSRANGDLMEVVSSYVGKLSSLIVNTKEGSPHLKGSELVRYRGEDNGLAPIPIGLGFDEQMSGGIRPGEILFFVSPTNGGKTSMMLRTSVWFASLGKRVVYVSLEIDLDLIAEKVRNCITHIPVSDLDLLIVKKFPTKAATLEEIFAFVDTVEAESGKVDCVVIDYLDLLSYARTDLNWLELEDLTAKFRGICGVRKMVGITASQARRDVGGDSKIVDITDVSASMGKMFTADYVVTITPPNPLLSQSFGVLYLCKNRRGPKYLQTVEIDYGTLRVTPILVEIKGGTSYV